MGIASGLIADKDFIVTTLLSMVEEERHRIVSLGLMKSAECDMSVNDYLQKVSISRNVTKDQIIDRLTTLHESMKQVKFAGDHIAEVQSDVELGKTSDIIDQLDDLAFKFGSTGHHKLAFDLETIIKNIKSELGE
jgi:hypothetical protein